MAIYRGDAQPETPLKHKIYKEIKDDIIFGRLHSGEPLILQKICAEKNVSSAPVREALNLLSKEGLVDLSPYKRATVSHLELQDIDAILFMRCAIEPYAARLSVGHIPQQEIDDMRVQLQEVADHPSDAELYVASDLALHELLHAHCGSPLLSEIISNLKDKTIRLRYTSEHFSRAQDGDLENQKQVTRIVTREHLEILSAFETGNSELVYNRVLQHITNYGVRLNNERPYLLDAIQKGEL